MTKLATIIEGGTVPNSGALVLTNTIKQDGSALNLTGKTVTATVRAEAAPDTTINAALEDHAVTITTAASGIVTLTLSSTEMGYLAGGDNPWQAIPYLIAFKTDDPYFPQLVRIYVHGVLD